MLVILGAGDVINQELETLSSFEMLPPAAGRWNANCARISISFTVLSKLNSAVSLIDTVSKDALFLKWTYILYLCVSLDILIRAANFVAKFIFVYVIMGPLLFQCLFFQYRWRQTDCFNN